MFSNNSKRTNNAFFYFMETLLVFKKYHYFSYYLRELFLTKIILASLNLLRSAVVLNLKERV